MPDPRPLGVFDSGVGGLTVVRALQEKLPSEDILYLGDTARVPYGNKSKETVLRYSREISRFLLQRDVKMIIAACNTASAFAVKELRNALPVPVVGVIEPGVATALAATRGGGVGIIGTVGTIQSRAYQQALLESDPALRITAMATPLLVPLIEENWLDHDATRLIVRSYLEPLIEAGTDTLVLACTHYPLLKPLLASLLGPGVHLVDSATACAGAVAGLLQESGAARGGEGNGQVEVCLTDIPAHFAAMAARFLKSPPSRITRVAVDSDDTEKSVSGA